MKQEVIIENIEESELVYSLKRHLLKNGEESLHKLIRGIIDESQNSFISETIEFSNSINSCECVKGLSNKSHLSHRERLVLLNLLMWFGEEGEAELRSILERQNNYSKKITDYQIQRWKQNGGNKPIKKITLKEWGICHC